MIILIVYFEYMIGSFSFALTGKCNSMVDLPQRAEILTQLATIKCNATTGEEYCESSTVARGGAGGGGPVPPQFFS